MSFQPCPICMGLGVMPDLSKCSVCSGKKIIDSSTGKPPVDEGCGPSYCENCGCGKKDAAIKKLPSVAGLMEAQEKFKAMYQKEPSQALIDAIESIKNKPFPRRGEKPFAVGQEIRFHGKDGDPSEVAEAKGILTPGNTYKVKTFSSGGWANDVELEGFDFLLFNSIMFEEV